MSKYTVQYGTIYDSGFPSLLSALSAYPIFNENHRAELNQKIYNRYRFREIGFETPEMFVHYFKTLLLEIMPYYNELYKTAAAEYDFLKDADYTETETVETQSESTGTAQSETTDNSRTEATTDETRARSDTPQGSFNFSDISGNHYLTEAEISHGATTSETTGGGTSESNSTASGSGESSREKHVSGKFPGRSYADMIREYREQIINIDVLILDELNVCFMGIY